jgi:hypothetical protein
LFGFSQVWTKISCWFMVQNNYHPFLWWTIRAPLQLKHSSSALARLVKTSLSLCRCQACTYRWQHSSLITEWLMLHSISIFIRPHKCNYIIFLIVLWLFILWFIHVAIIQNDWVMNPLWIFLYLKICKVYKTRPCHVHAYLWTKPFPLYVLCLFLEYFTSHNQWGIQGGKDETFSHIMLYCATEVFVHKIMATVVSVV